MSPPPELTSPQTFNKSLVHRGHQESPCCHCHPNMGRVPAAPRSHPGQEHPRSFRAQSPRARLCCHPPPSRPYSQGISASLRDMWPLLIPSHCQQPLPCPSSAQKVPGPFATLPSSASAESRSLKGNHQELQKGGGSVPVLWLKLSKSQCLSLK